MYNKTGSTLPRTSYEGLTPIQSDKAKDFLRSLLLGSVMAKNAGVEMDITKCIQAYRGHVGRKA
jgi:hypothetical protein